jgi:fructose-bisphosphate aldolase class 1
MHVKDYHEVGNWKHHSYIVKELCAHQVIHVLSSVHLADGWSLIFQCASAGIYPVIDPVVEAAIEVVETKRSQNGTTLTLKKLAKFLSNEKEAICNS